MKLILKNISVRNNTLQILLPRELDDHIVQEIRTELDREIGMHKISTIIFDFKATEFMDSSGIGMILGRYRKMQYLNGEIRVINASGRIREILELSGISKLVKIVNGGAI